jgi:hypothetical protein
LRARFLVVVRDFDFVGIAILPLETNPILLVDANAVLPAPATNEALQAVARRDRPLAKLPNAVELGQLASMHRPQAAQFRKPFVSSGVRLARGAQGAFRWRYSARRRRSRIAAVVFARLIDPLDK